MSPPKRPRKEPRRPTRASRGLFPATGGASLRCSSCSFHSGWLEGHVHGVAGIDGVPGMRFTVDVEGMGEPGKADTFKLVLGDGYTAGGVLLKGNIQVRD